MQFSTASSPIPAAVGMTAAAAVQPILPVSFFIVSSVVLHGECIKVNSTAETAVIAVQPLPESTSERAAYELISVRQLPDVYAISIIGITFITAYNVIASIFRGLGDSKSPMYFIAIACVANIALDYIFIGAIHMGPEGAALGTTLSQTISVVVSLWVILKKQTGISVKREDFRPDRVTMGQVLKIGIPIAAQDGFIQVAFIIITIIANRRGLSAAAAVGIVEKIISFLFLVPSSMLSTVSALGAQNMGAGKYDRADQILRYAMGIAVGFGLFVSLLIQVTAETAVGLFTTDAVVILLVLSAVITPSGDPFTLMVVFLPLYLLYELGILIVRE